MTFLFLQRLRRQRRRCVFCVRFSGWSWPAPLLEPITDSHNAIIRAAGTLIQKLQQRHAVGAKAPQRTRCYAHHTLHHCTSVKKYQYKAVLCPCWGYSYFASGLHWRRILRYLFLISSIRRIYRFVLEAVI